MKTGKTTTGFTQLPKPLENDFKYYKMDENTHILISSFETQEYECHGTCTCEPEERRSSIALDKPLIVMIAALSSYVAYKHAEDYFKEECQTSMEESCYSGDVVSMVEECEPIHEVSQENEKDVFLSEEDFSDEYRFMCSGNCLTIDPEAQFADLRAWEESPTPPRNYDEEDNPREYDEELKLEFKLSGYEHGHEGTSDLMIRENKKLLEMFEKTSGKCEELKLTREVTFTREDVFGGAEFLDFERSWDLATWDDGEKPFVGATLNFMKGKPPHEFAKLRFIYDTLQGCHFAHHLFISFPGANNDYYGWNIDEESFVNHNFGPGMHALGSGSDMTVCSSHDVGVTAPHRIKARLEFQESGAFFTDVSYTAEKLNPSVICVQTYPMDDGNVAGYFKR